MDTARQIPGKVSIKASVLRVNEPQIVGANKYLKKYVTIADKSGTATLTLWGDHIGSLEVSKSYQMNKLEVRFTWENANCPYQQLALL